MNRRNLLRGAGSLALGLPALSASRLMASPILETSSSVKDLIVTFDGPFCYWIDESKKVVKVMAPPVGTDYLLDPHQGWIGTNSNEIALNSISVSDPPEYTLSDVPLSQTLKLSGTPIFDYEQGNPKDKKPTKPLFTFIAPFPDLMVGGRPNYVDIKESDDPKDPQLLAVGVTFYYKNVDLSMVRVKINGEHPFFHPCFDNDTDLPCASLGVHLSPVHQTRDHLHVRAKHVWKQMLSMYPWIDIKGIGFRGFDSADCPPKPAPKTANNGPGYVCEVVVMALVPPGKRGLGRKY